MTDSEQRPVTTPSGSRWAPADPRGGPPYWQLAPAGARGVAADPGPFVAECAVCLGTIYRPLGAGGRWVHVRMIDGHDPRPLEDPTS